MEEINYDIMRYILDSEGYVEEVAFGGDVVRDGKTCTEYTGNIPEGYENLLDWSVTANIRAYKVVDKNLAYDPNRDYKLRILFDQEAEDNRHITKKEMGMTSTNETNPYANLFPNLTVDGEYVIQANTYDNIGNFSTEKVELWNYQDQDIDLIELEFIGKNFLPNTATGTTNNGITYTPNIDKTIDVSGIATDKSTLNLAGTDTSARHILTFKRGHTPEETDGLADNYYDYAVFGLEEGMSLEFYNYDGTDRTLIGIYKNNDVIRFEKDTNVTQVVLVVDKGTSINTTIKPMLALVRLEYPVMPMKKYHNPSLIKFSLTEQTKEGITASYDETTQTFTFNGTSTLDNNTFSIAHNIPSLTVPANKKIYWKLKLVSGSATGYFAVRAFESGYKRGVHIESTSGVISDLTSSKSYTTDTTYSMFSIRFENGSVANNLKIKLMLSYEDVEYQDYDGRDGQYYVDGVSTQETTKGNQLIDFANPTGDSAYTTTSFENDVLIIACTDGGYQRAYWNILDLIKNNAGKTLYFDYESFDFSKGKSPIIQLVVTNNGATSYHTLGISNKTQYSYTIPSDISGITSFEFGIWCNNTNTSGAYSISITKPMLQFGTDELEYEKYTGGVASPNPDYPSEIINIYKAGTYNAVINNKVYIFTIDEDLRSIVGVGDRLWLDVDGGIDIERKVGKIVLDGSENWEIRGTGTPNWFYRYVSGNSANQNTLPLSNYYEGKVISSSNTEQGIIILTGGDIRIRYGTEDTVENFKTWLSNNNTEVLYKLATYTTSFLSEYSQYEYEYEEYKNNTTLIDLAGNKFERFDSVVIENNQAFLVKEGALKYEDENGNEIEKERETVFLDFVSMPRTYTPYTHCYSHQRVMIPSFTYRDCRNIDMTKIDLSGSLTINEIETDNLLLNGVSLEENITTAHETATTTIINGTRIYKKLFRGRMPSDVNSSTNIFLYDVEAKQVWIDNSLSFIYKSDETLTLNYHFTSGGDLSTWVNKNLKSVRFNSSVDLSGYSYNIVLAYVKGSGLEEEEAPVEPEEPIENPIVEVNKSTTLDGSTTSSVWSFKTVATETKIDKINKTSTITVTNYIGRKSSSSYFMGTYTTEYSCGGKTYSETLYKNSGTIAAGGWCELGSHTFTIAHTTEPMTVTVIGKMSTTAFTPSNASASGTITLTEI